MVEDQNRVMQDRRQKMESLRESGVNPFANGFEPSATCLSILEGADPESLPTMSDIPEEAPTFSVGGRIMAKNKMSENNLPLEKINFCLSIMNTWSIPTNNH